MTCNEVQLVLPEIMEGAQDAQFTAHLRSCPACSELLADLHAISSNARHLSEAEAPPDRVWLRIAADLRAEGVIREPEAALPAPASTPRHFWRAWWMVPVAAALLAGASYVLSHRPAATVAVQNPAPVQAPAPAAPAMPTPAAQAPPTVAQANPPKPATHAGTNHAVEPGPSPEDQQFLSEVSQRAPSMRATYEDQLRSVNAYIQAAEAYLAQNPDDEEAREHLLEAYQQKALLYQLALDHIQ